MTNRFKKIIVGIVASAMCVTGTISAISASATSWEASHVNVPGAPGSESKVAYITVYHRAAGATATCNYNSHSNSRATTGTTTIRCTSHTMSDKTITKTSSTTCNPNVGAPYNDIAVNYKVSAYTPTSNDVFWSKGNIVKRS